MVELYGIYVKVATIYFSQKQLSRKMNWHLVVIELRAIFLVVTLLATIYDT